MLAAFGGGLLSFLSPCVLPMVPVYLASITGTGYSRPGKERMQVFMHSLSFVIGFSIIFVVLGAVAGLTGFAISPSVSLLNRVSGIVLIFFGVFMIAALKIPWLNYEARLKLRVGGTASRGRTFLIGGAFALAWTACVGPILAGILTLAMNSATVGRGASLLAVYSVGLGVLFLVVGAMFDSIAPKLKGLQRYSRFAYAVSGILLVAMGVLVLANKLNVLTSLA